MVRALGHEAADDHDDKRGTAWWNEVVGRIESSDVFVAVASPSYAEAHACRLAAKHAAASGLPVVRVDLDDSVVPDCPPVVAAAVGVPFAPEDPAVVDQLARALLGLPPAAPQWVPPDDYDDRRRTPRWKEVVERIDATDVFAAAFVTLLGAVALVLVGLSVLRGSEPSAPPVPEATASQVATVPGVSATPSTSPPAPPLPAPVAGVLAGVEAVDSPLLPASSCQAGADAVTCTSPAANIETVVLTPFASPAELYAAYTAEVESLSGGSMTENTGNCSNSESEGEVGWNLDKGHTLDFSVAQQESGGLDPASDSAGRVFCTDTHKVMSLVWTQDPGLLVTVTGQPSELVVSWWSDLHLQLACASGGVGSGCAES